MILKFKDGKQIKLRANSLVGIFRGNVYYEEPFDIPNLDWHVTPISTKYNKTLSKIFNKDIFAVYRVDKLLEHQYVITYKSKTDNNKYINTVIKAGHQFDILDLLEVDYDR